MSLNVTSPLRNWRVSIHAYRSQQRWFKEILSPVTEDFFLLYFLCSEPAFPELCIVCLLVKIGFSGGEFIAKMLYCSLFFNPTKTWLFAYCSNSAIFSWTVLLSVRSRARISGPFLVWIAVDWWIYCSLHIAKKVLFALCYALWSGISASLSWTSNSLTLNNNNNNNNNNNSSEFHSEARRP